MVLVARPSAERRRVVFAAGRPVDPERSDEILRWFASSDLPKIAAYAEAIQSKDGLWYKHAMSQGWASASARLNEYKRVGQPGNSSDLFTVTVSKAPKGPKSRC